MMNAASGRRWSLAGLLEVPRPQVCPFLTAIDVGAVSCHVVHRDTLSHASASSQSRPAIRHVVL
jgi:hypothetical protein